MKSINIDIRRTIRKVSLKLDGQKITGMRLVDEKGNYAMNVTWGNGRDTVRTGKWITRTITRGLEIIGM